MFSGFTRNFFLFINKQFPLILWTYSVSQHFSKSNHFSLLQYFQYGDGWPYPIEWWNINSIRMYQFCQFLPPIFLILISDFKNDINQLSISLGYNKFFVLLAKNSIYFLVNHADHLHFILNCVHSILMVACKGIFLLLFGITMT